MSLQEDSTEKDDETSHSIKGAKKDGKHHADYFRIAPNIFFLIPVVSILLLSAPMYYNIRWGKVWKFDKNHIEDFHDNIDHHIKYGEMISLAYDLIETDHYSINVMENYLGCDNEMEPVVECFFKDYKYIGELRAFPRSPMGTLVDSFFGFKAVNEKSGDLAVIFRGTVFGHDWGSNIRIWSDTWENDYPVVCVDSLYSFLFGCKILLHSGFHDIYKSSNGGDVHSLQIEIKMMVEELINQNKNYKGVKTITITGHSLGASIATIATLEIAEAIHQANRKCSKEMNNSCKPLNVNIRLINFANPLVGNYRLWDRLDELNVSYYHYFNSGDSVPWLTYGLSLYTPGPQQRQRRMLPDYKLLKSKWESTLPHWLAILVEVYLPFGSTTMAHNIAHILYNMAQVSNQSNRVDVALLNKFEDNLRSDEYPKGWFKLQTRHITRVNNKIAEVKVDACNHSARWSYKFTKEFARLHGQTCEPQWWRKLLGKDNFPDN